MNQTSKVENRMSVIFIIVITFMLYGNTLWNNYSGDDGVFITDNSITMSGLARTGEIFTGDGVLKGWLEKDKTTAEENGLRKRYRPLSQFTFAVEVQFFGANPHISHLFNVLFYALTAVLIFFIFFRISLKSNNNIWFMSFPLLLTILFVAHPIHTEVVANIKGRDEILALLFSLLSLYFTIKFIENHKYSYLIGCFITFFLALLSKENAITFLAIIPLTIFCFDVAGIKDKREGNKLYGTILLPLILSTVIFLVIRSLITGQYDPVWEKSIFNNYFADCTTSQKYGTIFYSLGKYLQLLIFPFRLKCDYSVYEVPVTGFSDLLSIGSMLIYLSLLAYALVKIKTHELISYGILFFLFSLSIYSNLFFSSGTALAERFLYISSLGFCIILSYFISIFLPLHIKHNILKLVIPAALLAIILSLYTYKTIYRNREWKDWKTLFKADLSRPNNCARLNEVYAELFYDGHNDKSPDFKDKVKTAKKYYLKAVTIYPGYTDALNKLAACYYAIDRNYDSTIYYSLQSLKKDKNQLQVYKNIVYLLDTKDDNPYALKIFKELVLLNPVQPILNYRLGKCFKRNNEPDSAIIYMEKAVDNNYNYSQAVNDLIILYEDQNIKKKMSYQTFFRLAQLYYSGKKDMKKSIYYLEKANELMPGNSNILKYLVNIYRESGDSTRYNKYRKMLDGFDKLTIDN
jgi:protein O-mannosyl-transferase